MGATETKTVVDKIAASRRQLDTAIWLWFNHGDIVSIHTLTDAAFGIVLDLYHVRRWKLPIPFDDEPPGGAAPKKWRKKVKEAGAFGKHARSDHDRAYEYNHIFLEAYLVCAVAAHSRLERPAPDCLRFIFWLWFDFQYPHLVKPLPMAFESKDVEQLKKDFSNQVLADIRPEIYWQSAEAGSLSVKPSRLRIVDSQLICPDRDVPFAVHLRLRNRQSAAKTTVRQSA